MNDEKVEALLAALKEVRRGRELHWEFVATEADGKPFLQASRKAGPLTREAKATRKTATDKRRAAGTVKTVGDRQLEFTVAEGSAKPKYLAKAFGKEIPKAYPALGSGRRWLKDAAIVQGTSTGTGLGIDRRAQAEGVSKTSEKSDKKLSVYSRFLDALDEWHREFGDGVPDMADMGRARALLDQIEVRANKWLDGHGKKMLEGSARKKRRKEIQKVLGQVAEARRTLMNQKLEGYTISEDDREALRQAEKTWMDQRVEEEQLKVQVWSESATEAMQDGLYGTGTLLGKEGTFGYVKLFELESPQETGTEPPSELDEGEEEEDEEIPPRRLVAKFQTNHGKDTKPQDLHNEARFYETLGPHPNIARCMGIRELDGEECLLMEALEGGDMSDFIADGARWVEEGLLTKDEYTGALQHILRCSIRALQHMHERGAYHSDIKPMNIMIDVRTGEAKLIDLGVVTPHGRQHGTAAYTRGVGFLNEVGQADKAGIGMSTFEGLEGDLPDYRPERMEAIPDQRIRANAGLRGDERELVRENFTDEEWQRIEDARALLMRRERRGKFNERGEQIYEQSPEHRKLGGLVPWLGKAQEFVNRLTSFDQPAPSLEEMLEMPFLDDSILGAEEAQAVLKKLAGLRQQSPRPEPA